MIMDERTGPNNCNGPEFCPRLCGPVRVLVGPYFPYLRPDQIKYGPKLRITDRT